MIETPPAEAPNARADRVPRAIAAACGLVVLTAVAGWAFDVPLMLAWGRHLAPMMPMAALALGLAAWALWVSSAAGAGRLSKALGGFMASLVAAYALLALVGYARDWRFGFEEQLIWFFDPGWEDPYPGRPAVLTVSALLLLGCGLLPLSWQASHALAAGAAAIAYFTLVGYVFDVSAFYRLLPNVAVALPTALTLLALAVGVIARPPRRGLASLMASPGPGGIMLRWLLAPALALPLVLGWVRASMVGWPVLVGVGFLITALALGLVVLLWFGAARLEALEAHRRQVVAEAMREHLAAEQARELGAVKDHLLSTISHEIKTPISLITGYAELLEERYPGDALAAGIEEGATRLVTQLNRILDVSALLSGQMALYAGPVSLAEVIELVVEDADRALTASGRHLKVEVASDLPPVWGDTRRLIQILVELLDNAKRFTEPGDTVGVSAGREDDHLVLAVWDTGRGVPDEGRERLWDAFTRLDTSDSARSGGLGLGLAIVRGLAVLHGATTRLVSDARGGSRFEVVFPPCADAPA